MTKHFDTPYTCTCATPVPDGPVSGRCKCVAIGVVGVGLTSVEGGHGMFVVRIVCIRSGGRRLRWTCLLPSCVRPIVRLNGDAPNRICVFGASLEEEKTLRVCGQGDRDGLFLAFPQNRQLNFLTRVSVLERSL
jgi:hypothetical protein